MIADFKEKIKKGLVQLEFAESGKIGVIERKFTEDGVPIMKPTQEIDSAAVAELLANNDRQMDILVKNRNNLDDMAKIIADKEAEREKLAKGKAK